VGPWRGLDIVLGLGLVPGCRPGPVACLSSGHRCASDGGTGSMQYDTSTWSGQQADDGESRTASRPARLAARAADDRGRRSIHSLPLSSQLSLPIDLLFFIFPCLHCIPRWNGHPHVCLQKHTVSLLTGLNNNHVQGSSESVGADTFDSLELGDYRVD